MGRKGQKGGKTPLKPIRQHPFSLRENESERAQLSFEKHNTHALIESHCRDNVFHSPSQCKDKKNQKMREGKRKRSKS